MQTEQLSVYAINDVLYTFSIVLIYKPGYAGCVQFTQIFISQNIGFTIPAFMVPGEVECVIHIIDFQKAAGHPRPLDHSGTVSAVWYQLDTVLGVPTDIFITIHIKLVEISRISVLIQSEEVS